MAEHVDVVIVGGGQAGLATSHELSVAGVEHVVLERARIAAAWRTRWDSFCLVTPNWGIQLPGGVYASDDPDGYLPRDGVVTYLEDYADAFSAPVREGVDVRRLEPNADGFLVRTSDGDIGARSVVLCTGAYQRPHRPPGAGTLPVDLAQLDAEEYRNPETLPPGAVLVVGSGQTGCQLAEELHMAGREVVLACGRAPWVPRRIGDADVFRWIVDTGYIDQPVAALPTPAARLAANVQATGRDGGHDLHLRTLRDAGVTLVGHFIGATDHRARFAADLDETVAWGDQRYLELMALVRKVATERGGPVPPIPEPGPFDGRAPEDVDLSGFGAVVFAGGFRPDYGSLIDAPEAFDELGFPLHTDGASDAVPGLSFVGVHFLRTRKSSLLYGVGEDAAIVARDLAVRLGA